MRRLIGYVTAFCHFIFAASFIGYSMVEAISEASWKVFFPVVSVLAVIVAVAIHYLGVMHGIIALLVLWYLICFLAFMFARSLFGLAD